MPSFKPLPPPRAVKAIPLAALLLVASAVQADPLALAPPGKDRAPEPVHASAPAQSPPSLFKHAAGMEDSRLEGLRGGSSALTDVDQGGVVLGNTAQQVTTGSNMIIGDSFANSTGIPTIIQNTGANVLIQSSTTIQVQLN